MAVLTGTRRFTSLRLWRANPQLNDRGASQTTMRGFIPLDRELISSGIHKISMRLVIDPTNDPVSRRYDQADSLGSRHLNSRFAPGEDCSLDCDVVIDRAVPGAIAPTPDLEFR